MNFYKMNQIATETEKKGQGSVPLSLRIQVTQFHNNTTRKQYQQLIRVLEKKLN